MDKVIRIECTGADLIDINDLQEMQGKLKELSETAYNKLKQSILDLGFSYPVNVWRSGGKMMILDAHQRVRTLKRMRDEDGYQIPLLPVSWVDAKNKKVAAKKLLAAASQYGEVTFEGMKEFMIDFDINPAEMIGSFKFVEIDLEKIFAPLEVKEVSFKVKTGAKELAHEEFMKFDHECPKCGFGWDGDA